MHKIIFSPILLIILLYEVLDVKVMEERKMKITFQKWIPNIVKRGNNFRVKKKKMSLLLHGILKSLFASNLSGSGKS